MTIVSEKTFIRVLYSQKFKKFIVTKRVLQSLICPLANTSGVDVNVCFDQFIDNPILILQNVHVHTWNTIVVASNAPSDYANHIIAIWLIWDWTDKRTTAVTSAYVNIFFSA